MQRGLEGEALPSRVNGAPRAMNTEREEESEGGAKLLGEDWGLDLGVLRIWDPGRAASFSFSLNGPRGRGPSRSQFPALGMERLHGRVAGPGDRSARTENDVALGIRVVVMICP
jgi:hypothetical protein